MQLKTAFNKSLKGVILDDRDQAAVELAKLYAGIIDQDNALVEVVEKTTGKKRKERKTPEVTWRYGMRFLDVLGELGMTPKARASVLHGGRPKKGGEDDGGDRKPASALDRLRRDRENRAAS